MSSALNGRHIAPEGLTADTMSAGVVTHKGDTVSDQLRRVGGVMNFGGERLEGVTTGKAKIPQRTDLLDIGDTIASADKHTVRIAHVGDVDFPVFDTRDMNQPGQIGIELLFACKVMMKGVVNELERMLR